MNQAPLPVAWTPTAKRAHTRPPEKVAAAVDFIYGPVAENPRRAGKALRLKLVGLHSAGRGDGRIIYRISDVVTIMAIDDRADLYRNH